MSIFPNSRLDLTIKSKPSKELVYHQSAMRAMDFISKLDPKRYSGMMTQMRNNACQNLPEAYPKTLTGAFRIASTWTRDGALIPMGAEIHSAFLADCAFVTKSKDPKKEKTAGLKKGKEKRSPTRGLTVH